MVVALGGVFIYSEEPKKLADWYERNLGLTYQYTENNQVYYVSFPHREAESDQKRYTVFSILSTDNRPLLNDKSFAISLRVINLEQLIEKLKKDHVVVRDIEKHEGGKYTWINDPEGNYIELWEDESED